MFITLIDAKLTRIIFLVCVTIIEVELLCCSVWVGRPGSQRPGSGDARRHGRSLPQRHALRAPSAAGALHLPPDALPLRRLSGNNLR